MTLYHCSTRGTRGQKKNDLFGHFFYCVVLWFIPTFVGKIGEEERRVKLLYHTCFGLQTISLWAIHVPGLLAVLMDEDDGAIVVSHRHPVRPIPFVNW